MNKKQYLQSIGVRDEQTMEKCLLAMDKYGDNHWWLEQKRNPRKFAYYQLKEEILLCDFSVFHKAISGLLGRPVYTHEFGLSSEKLVEEAERAYHEGHVPTEKESRRRVGESMQQLADYAEQNNKQFQVVELPEDNKNN